MKPPANKPVTPNTLVNQPGSEGGSVGVTGSPEIDIEATETVRETLSIKSTATAQVNNPGSEGGSVG
jgi:hypothetical protein